MAQRDDLAVKRLGRPRDTDSADTRRRILGIARAGFAENGYEASTNRDLAAKVGITAGALYHYFGSKLDLYQAVYEDVQRLVDERLVTALAGKVGFAEQFDAVLEGVRELNRDDPTLAAFVGASRVDARRVPEIRASLTAGSRFGATLVEGLVDAAISHGELAEEHGPLLREFVVTILVGLTDGMSNDIDRHGRAIESIRMVLRGDLLAATER